MSSLEKAFARNRAWAAEIKKNDPDFFIRLSQQQAPEFLWIGCSDSRVPANQIIDLPPGEVFVHRNVANIVSPSDLNCLSVMQFAIEALGVKTIIICGHYGCGGVKASLESADHGLIDNWLQHLRLVQRFNADELADITDDEQKCDRLCELNVIEQVRNAANSTVVQGAWTRGLEFKIHGCIYSLRDGILRGLCVHDPSGLRYVPDVA